MKTYMFQYSIPADNHYTGRTDGYINVVAEWDERSFYNSGKNDMPLVHCIEPVNLSFSKCISIKDWALAYDQIRKIAENHFAEIARQEKIAKAMATLLSEGEPVGIPTLDRYTQEMHELTIQETFND